MDVSEFPRNGMLHEAPEGEAEKKDDGGGQEGEDSDSDSSRVGYSTLDWRQKGYVTSVRRKSFLIAS